LAYELITGIYYRFFNKIKGFAPFETDSKEKTLEKI